MNAAAPDHIGVHAGSAVGLADLVDDQDVEIVARQGGEIVAMAFEKGRLFAENFLGRDCMNFGRLVKTVLQYGQAGPDFA